MIDLGGRRLEVVRVGAEKGAMPPTYGSSVIFESGIGTPSRALRALVPRVGGAALWYSRFGYGNSDSAKLAPGAATAPRTPAEVAAELHRLLEASGLSPPYVLVGASYGGLIVRHYALAHPERVAGLVLIDPAHERWCLDWRAVDPAGEERFRAYFSAHKTPAARAEFAGALPLLERGALDVADAVLPDVPTAVLTSTRPDPGLPPADIKRRLDDALLANSSESLHLVTARAGHDIQVDDPELVLGAIRWVRERSEKPAIAHPNADQSPATR